MEGRKKVEKRETLENCSKHLLVSFSWDRRSWVSAMLKLMLKPLCRMTSSCASASFSLGETDSERQQFTEGLEEV